MTEKNVERSMIVGIMGELGSACDAASHELFKGHDGARSYRYLTGAANVVSSLNQGDIDCAVIALESPVGIPIAEVSAAFADGNAIEIVSEIRIEVRHCLMALPGVSKDEIQKVASHEVPLRKHRQRLLELWPDYQALEVADTGLAARLLAAGIFDRQTAVIALPRAAEIFGLSIVERELPANDNFLTRFVLVRPRTP